MPRKAALAGANVEKQGPTAPRDFPEAGKAYPQLVAAGQRYIWENIADNDTDRAFFMQEMFNDPNSEFSIRMMAKFRRDRPDLFGTTERRQAILTARPGTQQAGPATPGVGGGLRAGAGISLEDAAKLIQQGNTRHLGENPALEAINQRKAQRRGQ